MRSIVKLLIVLGFGALLSGCVVAPVGPGRAYVGVAAPAVVVRPYYYGHYYYGYGRRW
jgi:hypothetical protein